MKINKGMSVLLASMLIGGMLVGCSDSNNDSNKKEALTKTVENTEKDNKVTKDKKEEQSNTDNKNNSSKNIPKSAKKKSKAKEITTVESYKCKYCNGTIYYIIEDKEYGINGNICWDCYWDKVMEIVNEPIKKENNVDDDTEKQTNCSICGGHVGGKEMCECDGTIHHRTCHIDAYTCPSCNRYGLKHDPDIYGCPYCGYPNEVEDYEEPIQEADDVEEYEEEEEYNDEVDIIDDIDEDINN